MVNIYKEYTPPASGGGAYLKLEDGKPVRFRIMSEPIVFDSVFKKGEETKISTKYGWIVFNLDEKVAQIAQLPGTAYKLIANYGADEDWGDPLENAYNLKVTRRGTGLETEYSVVASSAKEELTEEQINECKGLDLIAMTEAGNGVERVQWLRDVISGGRTAKNLKHKDTVIDDIGDEPISLEDIPF